MNIKTLTVSNTPLHIIKTTQFKTINIVLRFFDDLNAENVTARHLMLMMLKANTKHYPTRQALSKHLEALYDTQLRAHSMNLGKKHVNQIALDFPNPNLINDGLMDDIFAFLKSLLFEPLFNEKTLNEEKAFLKAYFKAEYSNKTRYAAKRYYEHLYKDHPYNINPLGIEEKIDLVTLDAVKKAYDDMLKNPTLISVSGNIDHQAIKKYLSDFNLSQKPLPKDLFIKHDFNHLSDVKETLDLTQDRLFIGLKSGIYYKDDEFFAMSIFNTLLGEGSDSLLFDVIREKHALAYYVHSAYAPFSSLVTIVSGMEKNNIEKAKTLIRQTLEHIKNNAFSDEAFHLAKQQKISAIKKSYDNIRSLSVKGLRHALFDVPYKEEASLKAIDNVTRDMVVKVAKQCEIIFTYVLGGVDHEKN